MTMRNGDTIPITGELVVTTCWCGIQFAMPRGTYDWHIRRETNTTYCPLGHAGVVREPVEKKLEAAQARERHLEDQLRAAENDAEAVRRRLIRDRHRFANGVCPCCNRSFTNVARHMATKHPDYDSSHLGSMTYGCSCGREFGTPHGLRMHQAKTTWGTHRTVVA